MSDPINIRETYTRVCEFLNADGAKTCGEVIKSEKKSQEAKGLSCDVSIKPHFAPHETFTAVTLTCEGSKNRFDRSKFNGSEKLNNLWVDFGAALFKDTYEKHVLPEILRALEISKKGLGIYFSHENLLPPRKPNGGPDF